MNAPLSVSELNGQIKSLLETTFTYTYVQGEISNLTYHNSGHIYFSIKDNKSTLSCVMFKGNAQYLKFRLEVGQKINISGSVTVYTPRGNYQLLCSKIEPSGVGELALAYEQLKKKLQSQGYFSQEIKKPLPKYPKTIAIVTSSTGAAIQDMQKVAQHRWPLVKFILVPALVQGEGAKEQIVHAIQKADALNVDILIVGRGGGSIEDLWAFNEELVANAIYEAKTPVISAVGHEVDFVISDFVADVRASTPSNAIEIALPDINEMRLYLDDLSNTFKRNFLIRFNQKTETLNHLIHSFKQNSFVNKFKFIEQNIKSVQQKFNQSFEYILQKQHNQVAFLIDSFERNHPEKRVKKGFVQTTKAHKIVTLEEVSVDDIIDLETPTRVVSTKVLSIKMVK